MLTWKKIWKACIRCEQWAHTGNRITNSFSPSLSLLIWLCWMGLSAHLPLWRRKGWGTALHVSSTASLARQRAASLPQKQGAPVIQAQLSVGRSYLAFLWPTAFLLVPGTAESWQRPISTAVTWTNWHSNSQSFGKGKSAYGEAENSCCPPDSFPNYLSLSTLSSSTSHTVLDDWKVSVPLASLDWCSFRLLFSVMFFFTLKSFLLKP